MANDDNSRDNDQSSPQPDFPRRDFLKIGCLSLSVPLVMGSRVISGPLQVSRMLHEPAAGISKYKLKEAGVMSHASGAFEIKMNPQPDDKVGDLTVTRMSSDKHFHGDLEGASKGQMLGVYTNVKGSAGYVAIEQVTGTLAGRSGAFTLQHSAAMAHGVQQYSLITVVPDSGSGQLLGIEGKMTITIVDGKHFYEFEYTLPQSS